jgi:hypothetical protein
VQVGEDTIIERAVIPDAVANINLPPTEVTEVLIKYTYEKKPGVAGPSVMDTTRPFCKKLVGMDKMYSRSDIEQITQRLGYSVFDRAGGFWMQPDGTVSPSCRHYWKTNIVLRKKNKR